MNLDEQLRAALDQEADLRDVPRPDIGGLIRGGRARQRRRNANRFGAIAAAVVLIGTAAYGVTQNGLEDPRTDPGLAYQPMPPLYPDTGNPLEPGPYRKYVGHDGSRDLITAYLTFEDRGWLSTGQPVISENDDATWAGIGVLEPHALAGGASGCSSDDWADRSRQPAQTPQALGRQLTRLPRSTVAQPLTTTEAFGYDVLHLQLRIKAECPPSQYYRVVETDGDFGITWSDGPTTVVMDIWVVDVEGTPIVVALWHDADASSELVDQATRVLDSISFVTGE